MHEQRHDSGSSATQWARGVSMERDAPWMRVEIVEGASSQLCTAAPRPRGVFLMHGVLMHSVRCPRFGGYRPVLYRDGTVGGPALRSASGARS